MVKKYSYIIITTQAIFFYISKRPNEFFFCIFTRSISFQRCYPLHNLTLNYHMPISRAMQQVCYENLWIIFNIERALGRSFSFQSGYYIQPTQPHAFFTINTSKKNALSVVLQISTVLLLIWPLFSQVRFVLNSNINHDINERETAFLSSCLVPLLILSS